MTNSSEESEKDKERRAAIEVKEKGGKSVEIQEKAEKTIYR